MFFVAFLFLFMTGMTVNGDRHSLTYIYTAFKNPTKLPGIHKFIAMGLLNDKVIDYYDSDTQVKIPRQDWMKERLEADYWKKGTESRQSKERWFNVNIDILIERMKQNNTDLHILQWKHGCEGDLQSDGSVLFKRGIDSYSYDGNNFLFFDDANTAWVAPVPEAQNTKRKWDGVLALKDYTKGYLEKECIDWLSRFITYGKEQLRKASKPDIYLFTKKSNNEGTIILTCMATGFYPKHIILQIKRNDRVLTKEDGLETTGPRPNEDDTYQQKDSVEIFKSDKSIYKCIIIHHASYLRAEEVWNGKLPEPPAMESAVIGVVIGVALLTLPVVLFILWKKKKCCFNPEKGVSSNGVPFSGVSSICLPPSGVSSIGLPPSVTGSNKSVSIDSVVSAANAPDGESKGLLDDTDEGVSSNGLPSSGVSSVDLPSSVTGSNKSVSTDSGVSAANAPDGESKGLLDDTDEANRPNAESEKMIPGNDARV